MREALLLATGCLAAAMPQGLDEYQVKAAFICNFANFVEWPAAAFRGAQDPINICVVGHNPFGSALPGLTEGKRVNGRTLTVTETEDAAQAGACQIVFLSASERLRFRAILESLKKNSTLTVGDTKDFIAEGGVIALKVEGGRIHMQINAQAAKERNLHISAHLLSLAENGR